MEEAQLADDDQQINQYATFRLANELYGVDVMRVQEVLRYSDITPVPGAPRFVVGIINLRGNVVTVISTRERFGLEFTDITDNTRIVIIEAGGQVVGLLVDSVADVVYLDLADIENTPNVGNEETAKFIQGVCNKDEELLILLELESMIASSADEAAIH